MVLLYKKKRKAFGVLLWGITKVLMCWLVQVESNVVLDALSAESYACLVVLYATTDHGLSHIILESNSTILVDALQSRSYDFQLLVCCYRSKVF